MTSNADFAYPAEYYYPEFIDNRPEDPLKYPPTNLPQTASIENGVGSSTEMPIKTTKRTSIASSIENGVGSSTKMPIKTTKRTSIASSIENGVGSSTEMPIKTTKRTSISSSIENGVGSSTKMPIKTTKTFPTTRKASISRKQPPQSLAADITTNQGLPDTDITESAKTDPKKSLVRDPAERNIPRLIVDDSVIKQAVRTPRVLTTNLDDGFDQITYPNQTTYGTKHAANGHANGDLTNRSQLPPPIRTKQTPRIPTKQQRLQYIEEEPPVDDYWKKEVHIDDEGLVTIEPLKYDKNTYEGPFGLTRQGSTIFYVGVGILTLLAAVFLIMTGIFYSKGYPSSSSSTGTLTGIGICALTFYIGLQLILIGLWHQKYRQENPKKIVGKASRHNDSSAHLKTSMEESEHYDYSYQQPVDYSYQQPVDYSYQQPVDYGPYGYSNPPYVANVNEQMLSQQPGIATGVASYEAPVWPSNAAVETQPDPKFLQPMESTYGPPPVTESLSTVVGYTAPLTATNDDNTKTEEKPEKKRHHRRHHHRHNKKSVEADTSKPKFDSIQPESSVIEAPLPVLSKAPETNELLRSIAEAEKNAQQNSTKKDSNQTITLDDGTDVVSLDGQQHHSYRRHHYGRRHHRHRSHSPCSTCSDHSRNAFHSDVGNDNHHHHHRHHHHRRLRHQHSKPRDKIITPRPIRKRTSTPPRRNPNVYREIATGTGFEIKIMKDTGVMADLEDVPNVRDNRLEQIPIVRRTIIVEPYPAEPSSQIIIKPQSNMVGKVRLNKNEGSNAADEILVQPTSFFDRQFKKKEKPTREVEDLRLEDVNDAYDGDNNDNRKGKKRSAGRSSGKTSLKNAFYN